MLADIVVRSWGMGEIAIAVIVLGALVAIVFLALREMQVPVPGWVWQVLGILIVAVVCILAIKFLLNM